MLTWTYSTVLDIKGKHNFERFTIYTLQKYLPTRAHILTILKFRTRAHILTILKFRK